MTSEAEIYAEMVGVLSTQCTNLQLVAPGDAASSYLINKLTGQGMCGDGVQMPKRSPAWPATDIALIEAWINAGAPND